MRTYLGQSDLIIKDAAFDALFSISVVEHVTDSDLEIFFNDSRRIIKKEGFAMHLIDIYIAESPAAATIERCRATGELFFKHFCPMTDEIIGRSGTWEDALRFRTCYATNPDNAMQRWNKSVPKLREVRETHQSCTLLIAGLAK